LPSPQRPPSSHCPDQFAVRPRAAGRRPAAFDDRSEIGVGLAALPNAAPGASKPACMSISPHETFMNEATEPHMNRMLALICATLIVAPLAIMALAQAAQILG
jgi:hypothetical protein